MGSPEGGHEQESPKPDALRFCRWSVAMTSKNWTRLTIALALALAGSIVLLGSWSLRVTPQPRPKPKAASAQQKTSSQKEVRKASSTSASQHPDTGAALTTTPGSEKVDATESPQPAFQSQAPETLWDPALADLIQNTKDPNWAVRWDAVNALGNLKDRRSIPALVRRAVYDDNTHPRWRSLWALRAVDPTGLETIPSLRTALQDPDPEAVRNAAVGLAFFGQPEARNELLKGLNDHDSHRRWEAIFSLRGIGNHEVAQALVPLLDDNIEPDERIRSEIALTLGYMGSQEAIWPLLNALSGDPSPQVRWRAALTLSRVGNSSLIQEQLEQNLATEQDPKVIEHIKDALTEIRKR